MLADLVTHLERHRTAGMEREPGESLHFLLVLLKLRGRINFDAVYGQNICITCPFSCTQKYSGAHHVRFKVDKESGENGSILTSPSSIILSKY